MPGVNNIVISFPIWFIVYLVPVGLGFLNIVFVFAKKAHKIEMFKASAQQPHSMQNIYRSILPDIFVAYSTCTHLGCSLSYNPPGVNKGYKQLEHGVFHCPCHGAVYALSGRVHKGMPAPYNLKIPNYEMPDKHTVRIHRDKT